MRLRFWSGLCDAASSSCGHAPREPIPERHQLGPTVHESRCRTVPSGAAYGSYAGTTLVLQYGGFGQLWGIPGSCIDPVTNATVSCAGQNVENIAAFEIPDDPTGHVKPAEHGRFELADLYRPGADRDGRAAGHPGRRRILK
jgi:hypothetical protein